jgi:hypothetical protein
MSTKRRQIDSETSFESCHLTRPDDQNRVRESAWKWVTRAWTEPKPLRATLIKFRSTADQFRTLKFI